MMTVRHIERLWNSKSYHRLYQDLVAARPEASFGFERELATLTGVSALAVIRLDELSQSHVPICSRLVRTILTSQHEDGGWGDLATTALCLRALMCGNGDGVAIERGLMYLANLQKDEGIWPSAPTNRMPADPLLSLFILFELSTSAAFPNAIRFYDALAWFERYCSQLERSAHAMWDRVRMRCGHLANAGTGASLFAA
jgi:hypothetical protein